MPENSEWRDRIDEDVRGLTERMAGVETGMESLGKAFDKFTRSFEHSVDSQRDAHKTPWAAVFAALTLVVVVLTLILEGFLSGYVRDLNRVEGNVETIRSKRTSEADPVQDMRLRDVEQEIIAMRLNEHEVLQQDAQLDERVRGLTQRLDRMESDHASWNPVVLGQRIDGNTTAFEQFRTDINEKIQREITVHDSLRDELRRRVTLAEERWVGEHTRENHRE